MKRFRRPLKRGILKKIELDPVDVLIVSGFLGAGKTTLIQQLLEGPLTGRRTVLIENDFGELSLDAELLSEGGFTVQALSQGCICCSLTGEFVQAIHSVVRTYRPSVLLIEPSGVGLLTEILQAVRRAGQRTPIRRVTAVTVVDAVRCEMYHENFGAFFEDQIGAADAVLLSHTDENPADLSAVFDRVSALNSAAQQTADPADVQDFVNRRLSAATDEALERADGHGPETADERSVHTVHSHGCTGGCQSPDYNRDRDCGCQTHDHGRTALQTVTLYPDAILTPESLRRWFGAIDNSDVLDVVRAKGVVRLRVSDGEPDRQTEIQYVPNALRHRSTGLETCAVTFIGRRIDAEQLDALYRSAVGS